MIRRGPVPLLLLVALWLPADARTQQSTVTVAPGSVVVWQAEGTQTCHREDRSWPAADGTCYFAVDLLQTGRFEVMMTFSDGRYEQRLLEVGEYPYRVQRITLEDDRRVHLSPEDAARAERESARIAELWKLEGDPRFALPLGSPLERLPDGGRFGAKRIINGEPRSPHSGRDYAASAGTPVLATADGRVVLAEEHFFAGNSVFLDHGAGLVSMYFHLSEILVEAGQTVTRGQALGKVGSTGRSTGPHLHFGIRWRGARVDPALLMASPATLARLP